MMAAERLQTFAHKHVEHEQKQDEASAGWTLRDQKHEVVLSRLGRQL